MKRIALIVAYDGTNYCGWQIQDNAVTVEGVLVETLRDLLKEDVELIGASRTDSGVHARGNVAVFDTDSRIPGEKMAYALNTRLPSDIRIQKSMEVSEDFHPRYCDSEKTYEYKIVNTKIPIPTMDRYSYHVYRELDIEKMKKAGDKLVGTHDFTAFCSAGSQVKSKVRTVTKVVVLKEDIPFCEDGSMIKIQVSGTGFLYNMVRIIAGTLVEIGEGARSVEAIDEALSNLKRTDAGKTAPARGLTLMEIKYAML